MTNTNDIAMGATNVVAAVTNAAAALAKTTNGPAAATNTLRIVKAIAGDDPDTVISRLFTYMFGSNSSTMSRVLFIIGITVVLLLAVKVVRNFSNWLIYKSHVKKNPFDRVTQQPKFITVTWLVVSGISFVIYFLAVGLVLQEILHIDLTTYLASASIIGLAISFGSQGLVQDIVSGLTLIFCDAMDVGDLVEIVGAATVSGRVEKIGLRFTIVVNFLNQRVMIPNRTIANVSRFPHGGVDAYGDVHIPSSAGAEQAVKLVEDIAKGMKEQFGAIVFGDPTLESVVDQPGGLSFLRVHFRIWPGQSSLIETTFRQRVVSALKVIDPGYSDWQVPVTYRAMMGKAKS
jgi:small-conductance mechanosensitive channel